MHALRPNAPLRSYYLDLVYLNATLQAAGYTDLATLVQNKMAESKARRADFERAEELEVVASAAIAGRNLSLGQSLVAAASHVRAHHPHEYDEFFPKAASSVVHSAYQDEIRATRTLVARIETLPAADPVRIAFAQVLTTSAAALDSAIDHKDDVLRGATLVRATLDRFRAETNLLRLETHAELLKRTKDKSTADAFFAAAASSNHAHDDVTPASPPAQPAQP